MEYSDIEKKNIQFLQSNEVHFATVRMTPNILNHSIFDAKTEIRELLKEFCVHDFEAQQFGRNYKVFVKTHILTFKREILTETSLYRAETRGDERMWFGSAILPLANPNDVYVIIPYDKELYIVNVSQIDVAACVCTSISNPIRTIINLIQS